MAVKSTDSYAAQQKINQSFSAINLDNTVSTTDTLSTLRLISKMNEGAPQTTIDAQNKVIQSELKYLNAAMIAIQNPAISKHGKWFEQSACHG